MAIKLHKHIEQGSDDWYQARLGLLTASEIKLIMTPTLKAANNDKERAHLYELLAQRITGYIEPAYINDDMLRGQADEVEARIKYHAHYGEVEDMGFITNDKWGFTLGYSPDGLVGEDGCIEVKSRRQKYQIETICGNTTPDEYMLQIQTGLLVSERKWCDFISYSGGLPMLVLRVEANPKIQEAIIDAARIFEEKLKLKLEEYNNVLKSGVRWLPTERRIEQEIVV